MPYNANSMSNLQPFTGKDDSRRQNGRKAGSKNVKTITCELLEKEVDLSLPINEDMKKYLAKNSNCSCIEAITLAMIIKAINGDTRAAGLLFERGDQLPDNESVFDRTVLNFKVVTNQNESSKDNE